MKKENQNKLRLKWKACDAIKEIASLYESDKDAKAFMEALDKSTTTLCEGLSESKVKDDDITIIASESKKKDDKEEEEEIDETMETGDDEYLTRLSAIAKKKKMEESKKKDPEEEEDEEEKKEVEEAVIGQGQGASMTFQRLQKVAPDIAAKVGEVNWNKVVDKMMSEEEDEEKEEIEKGKSKQAPIEMEESKKKDEEDEKEKKLEKIEESIIKRATNLVV